MSKELFATVVAWDDLTCTVLINDTRYVYRSYNYSGQRLKEIFSGMARHSMGKAVNWIKKNADVVDQY